MNGNINQKAPQLINTAGPLATTLGSVSHPVSTARVRRGRRRFAGRCRIDFATINAATFARLPDILYRLLPEGKCCGREWVARNPQRNDRHVGSFSVNMHSGQWADFATGAKGGDVISLAAYLFGLSQVEAARQIAGMLGMAVGHD